MLNDNSCVAPNRRSAVSGLRVERVMLLGFTAGFDEKKIYEVIHLAKVKEVLSVLMLCAPRKRRRPFSYHTKMVDLKCFLVLSIFW